MKPPKTVTIGPYTYTLEPTADLLATTGAVGDTSEERCRIRIQSDLDPQMHRSVVLHEVLHACAFTAGISEKERLEQEQWIRRVEPVLYGVLRSNADLLAWVVS